VTDDADEPPPDNVANIVHGDVCEVVMAGTIHGGVHIHQPVKPDADEPEILDHVPTTEAEISYVIRNRPWSWEYMLFAGELQVGLIDRRNRPQEQPRSTLTFGKREAAIAHVATLLSALEPITQRIMTCLGAEVLSRALGDPPKRPGDWRLICDAAHQLLAVYDEMQGWSASVRGAEVPRPARRLYEITSHVADRPMSDIGTFVQQLVSELNVLLENASQGIAQSHVPTLACNLTADNKVLAELTEELRRARSRWW
jgi:hypothetical protein